MTTLNQAYCLLFFVSKVVEALASALQLQAATLQAWSAAAWQPASAEAPPAAQPFLCACGAICWSPAAPGPGRVRGGEPGTGNGGGAAAFAE